MAPFRVLTIESKFRIVWLALQRRKIMESRRNSNIEKIIRLFVEMKYPESLEDRVRRWIIINKNEKEQEECLEEIWDNVEETIDMQTLIAWNAINAKIEGSYQSPKEKRYKSFLMRVAAVVIPLIIISASYYILTTSNRSVDNIEDDIIQEYVSEQVIKADYQKYILLSDGSEVWLNVGGTISYPETFAKERVVTLNGEAFFSVQKDAARPFVVKTNNVDVRVLGTQFNVNAYDSRQETTVILAKGSVEVSVGRDVVQMKTNEKLTYNHHTEEVEVSGIDGYEALDWRVVNLDFNQSALHEVFHSIEQYYQVNISTVGNVDLNQLISVNLLEDADVYEAMFVIQKLSEDFRYEISGNEIRVIAINK